MKVTVGNMVEQKKLSERQEREEIKSKKMAGNDIMRRRERDNRRGKEVEEMNGMRRKRSKNRMKKRFINERMK